MSQNHYEIEKIRQFRLQQSIDKLKLSSIKIAEGLYNEAVILSFVSLFNSIRLLLCENGDDSDNYDKIFGLAEQYFTSTMWGSLDILEILKDARGFNENVLNGTGKIITRQEAEKYFKNAEAVLREVQLKINEQLT